MKLIDFKPYQSMNVLMKGDPGTGKTPAALSFPYPLQFFDVDFRAQSLLPFFAKDMKRLKNIDVIQPNHFDDIKNSLENTYNSIHSCPFKTIVIDTLTTYSDLALRGSMKEKGGSGGRKIGSVMIPGLQDYGDEAGILNEVMTLMRLIYKKGGINTILIAHVITAEEKNILAKDEANKVVYSRSLLTAGKKIGAKLPSYFDEVYHFEVRADWNNKPEFIVKTRHTGFDFARTGLDCPSELNITNWEKDPGKYFYKYLEKYLEIGKEDYEKRLEEEDKIERQLTVEVTEEKGW